MKIRSYVIFCFLLAAVLPTAFVSTWSYHETVSREFSEVKDRHLLLARKAAATLQHYHQALTATVEAAGASLLKTNTADEYAQLFNHLHILSVAILEKSSGKITKHTGNGTAGLAATADTLRAHLERAANPGQFVYSEIMAGANGQNLVHLIVEKDHHHIVGVIAPDFIITLGEQIVFGKKGHAAIVDQSGNVIAHPREDWVRTRRNIAGLPVVARMMKGETGIGEFYSPAVESNMIAGFTSVAGPGWGIMVPQPVSEIYSKAGQIHSTLLPTILIAFLLTLAIGWFLARSLSRPIENLANAMHHGALKQKLSPLKAPAGLVHFRETDDVCESYNTMVSRITMASEQIEKLAFSDHVTGLPNREHLNLKAKSILEEAINPQRGGIILLIDLDDFKEINDLYGHHAGDLHLQACANTLSRVTQTERPPIQGGKPFAAPIVARIGGDEFIVMVQGMLEETDIQTFLATVRTELTKPLADLNTTPGASIGCARFPNDGVELKELIKRADIAMYHAKRSGKNQTQIYTPLIGTKSVAEIRQDLTLSLETGDLFLEYQPKICTRRRKVISIEALARWEHPELGRFMPKSWVPSLLGSNAMPRLGEWVIETAMRDLTKIRADGHDLWMSVNIGSDHFMSSGFVDAVERLRNSINFEASRLEIEVTEDTLFNSEERAIETFNRLHGKGYKISIDDFGVGYSNMTRLANLPVDFLKVDQSIIAGACNNPRVRKIMAATISMAKDLGCATVAEGIETQDQAEFATQLGTDCLQGYYFTGGLQRDDLIAWLNAQSGPSGHLYLRAQDTVI